MITPAEFERQADGITLETLLESGGTKWSGGGGKIGAWVAEMDLRISMRANLGGALNQAM